MATRKWIGGGVAVVGAGALFAWAFQQDPTPVDVAEVFRGEMTQTVNVDGKTRIRDIYEVSSPISGRANRSPVEVGGRVIAGKTVVAVVEPAAPSLLDTRERAVAEATVAEAEAALQVAMSLVTQAEEDLALANTQYVRTAELVSRGVASQAQLESVAQLRAVKEAALNAARSNQTMADGTLARARSVLVGHDPENGEAAACCVELHAPIDGVVLSVANVSERPVTMGASLVEIGQPTDLEIVADVLSADAVRLAPGSRAIVERWGGDRPLEAVLRKVEPSAKTKVSALGIEEQRVDVVFDLLSPAGDRPGLRDGFSVFLQVVEWRSDDELQVPLSALFRDGPEWFVFRVQDGLAVKTAVEVGRSNDQSSQVLSGLSESDLVVAHPSDRVSDGASVVDRRELE